MAILSKLLVFSLLNINVSTLFIKTMGRLAEIRKCPMYAYKGCLQSETKLTW